MLAMNSLWEKNSFSLGADVKGTLVLFFWLNSSTGRQPGGDRRGHISLLLQKNTPFMILFIPEM